MSLGFLAMVCILNGGKRDLWAKKGTTKLTPKKVINAAETIPACAKNQLEAEKFPTAVYDLWELSWYLVEFRHFYLFE